MLLEGIGDPTGGLGGISFLRMPLKAKDHSKETKVLNPTQKAITGTDADLRRLTKIQIKQKLIEMGHSNDDL